MATIAQQSIMVDHTISGNSPQVLTFPEAASQTFKAGELVYLSSGYVTECGDDPSAILGVAADDAHNDASDGTHEVGVYIPNHDTVFRANVYHSTGASAVTAKTLVGNSYGVYRDTTNSKVYVDVEDTSNHRVIILALSRLDSEGDKYGRVLFQFEQKYCQLQTTS